jgi:hypothetical protein
LYLHHDQSEFPQKHQSLVDFLDQSPNSHEKRILIQNPEANMNKLILTIAVLSVLSACSGDGTNPFDDTTDEETTDDTGDDTTDDTGDDGTAIDGDRVLPPGSTSPTSDDSIFRSEPTTGNNGDGQAEGISYNSTDDTFTVDNLAFDGDNVYARGASIGSLGPYSVYEADSQYPDSATGTPINQLSHRAIYGVSGSTNTQFAIVRTGAYAQYGFGGFIYQRNNGVTLPDSGQASYSGTVAGIRDFNETGGLEFTTGDITIDIDFDDFNETAGLRGDAVKGHITNRKIYDIDGVEITDTVLARIGVENNITLSAIPTANFVIGPGVMDDNGEILGTINSYYTNSSGENAIFESGNYYAIVAGDSAEEIVGIVVLESSVDAIGQVRETSGFVVYR